MLKISSADKTPFCLFWTSLALLFCPTSTAIDQSQLGMSSFIITGNVAVFDTTSTIDGWSISTLW